MNGTTDFLSTLRPIDKCPAKANRVARDFMETKGCGDQNPIGVYIDGGVLYYYYRLPEGVLEVELTLVRGRWQRRVSDFIMREKEIIEMLGESTTPPEEEPPTPESVEPDVHPAPPVIFKGVST